jgi:hypothetical protein
MVTVDSIKEGEISVDGSKYGFSVWIFTDGRVMERQAIKLEKVAPDEIQTMIDNSEGLKEIVICGEIPVDEESVKLATSSNVLLAQAEMGEFLEFFNTEAAAKAVAAIVVFKG